VHSPCGYFKDPWNKFDFFLVIIGMFGGAMSSVEYVGLLEEGDQQGSESEALSEASRASRIIRIARVLRTMRLLRMFQLFHAMLSSDKLVSQKLAASMMKVQSLTSFVQAHITAQKQIRKFFVGDGGEGSNAEAEIKRCILQSLVSVHKALIVIIAVQKSMDEDVLQALLHKKETKRMTEQLEVFVQEAADAGAISDQEAHAILHPMHQTLASCLRFINKLDDGVMQRRSTQSKMESPRDGHPHGNHEKDAATNVPHVEDNSSAQASTVIESADAQPKLEDDIAKGFGNGHTPYAAEIVKEAAAVEADVDMSPPVKGTPVDSDETQGLPTESGREGNGQQGQDGVRPPKAPSLTDPAQRPGGLATLTLEDNSSVPTVMQSPQPPDKPDPSQSRPPVPTDKQHVLVLEDGENTDNAESALMCCGRPPRAAPKFVPHDLLLQCPNFNCSGGPSVQIERKL